MIFQEVGPNENLDVRRFSSAPFGLWEAGILKMGWGKARVRLMPVRGEDTIRTLKHAKRLQRSHVHGGGAAEIHLDRGSAKCPTGRMMAATSGFKFKPQAR